MIPYIKTEGENSITCDCDVIVYDDFNIVFVSLVDYPIKTKKIISDFYLKKSRMFIKDRENAETNITISLYGKEFMSKTDKIKNYNHTIIRNKDMDGYIIDWNNDGILNVTLNYLRNKLYLPITEEILNKINFEEYVTEISVASSNPSFNNLKAYKISKYWITEKIKKFNNIVEDDDFDWSEIETIEDYIYTFLEPIKNKITKTIKPLYNKNNIFNGIYEGIKPYKGQIPVIQSALEVLKRDRFVYLGCDMGFGKTLIASKINNSYFEMINKDNYNTLIIAPTITLTQWKDEIQKSFDCKCNIYIIKSTKEFINKYNRNNNIPTYYLIGKETFKLSYATEPSYNVVKRMIKKEEITRYGYINNFEEIDTVLTCPDCGKILVNPNRKSEYAYLEESDFKKENKSNHKCTECGSILWSATYINNKKTSVIDYIKRKKIMFDSVILDEAHESNNSGSLIGNSTRTLLRNHTKKIICLSGTNNNGYASSMHNLFMSLCPRKLKQDDCLDVKDFVNKYGTLLAVVKINDYKRSYRYNGKVEVRDSVFKETEGVNPIVFVKYLSENYIFATLDDVKDNLPNIITKYVPIKATDEQEKESNNIFNEIKKVNAFNAKIYIDTIIKHYINNPYDWKDIIIECGDKTGIITPANLNINILPKEEKLLEIVKSENKESRKVWIYCEFNNGGSYLKSETISKRLKRLIENQGLKVYELTTSISTYNRKEVIEKNKDKYDVFICNPRLVNVGINLTFCPTYIFYMPSYRVDIVSQASKRGYRANSTMENRIYHLYYENTIENDIIKRYQRKLAESNAINGEFNVDIEDDENIRTASKFGEKLI